MLMEDVIARSVRAIRSGNFETDEATMAIHLGAMLTFRETLSNAGQPTVLLDGAIPGICKRRGSLGWGRSTSRH